MRTNSCKGYNSSIRGICTSWRIGFTGVILLMRRLEITNSIYFFG
jgi:hypothetical protein